MGMVEQTSRKRPLTGGLRTLVVCLQRRNLVLSRRWLFWANLTRGAIIGLPWLAPVLTRIGARAPVLANCLIYGNDWPGTLTGNLLLRGPHADNELGTFSSWLRLITGFLFGWRRCGCDVQQPRCSGKILPRHWSRAHDRLEFFRFNRETTSCDERTRYSPELTITEVDWGCA